jgi:DNA-binding Lrp family transcriptional regulator
MRRWSTSNRQVQTIVWRSLDVVPTSSVLDDIDRRILAELVKDGRVSIPILAERAGVARATAYARFEKLVSSGVIEGFTARVSHEALGNQVCALLLLSARQGAWHEMKERLATLPGVEWVGLCTGAFDFVLRVRVADLKALRALVLDELQSMPEIRNSQTILVLDEV